MAGGRGEGRRGRGTLAAIAVATVLAVGLSVAPPTARPVLAAGPLRVAADATYTLEPAAGRVEVAVEIAATNQKPSTPQVIYYYRDLVFAVQREASRIRAVDDRGGLGVTTRHRANYVQVTVRLRELLYFGQTARFEIRYDLVGGEPRSDSPIRVGDAFASFGVWAWGDPGLGSVQVRTPPGFGSQVLGDAMERRASTAGQTLEARPGDPATFYAVVLAENPAAYERTRLSLPNAVEVVVLAWPEDDAWSDTVAETLRHGLPALQGLIGLDWPVDRDLEVRERFTPLLEGYAGVFYEDQSIDVSEDLDPLVIVHEAAHAWFDADLFAERWIYEGLAEEYAWRVRTDAGDEIEPPGPPDLDDPGHVLLTGWVHPRVIRDEETDDRERYGYAAAWWVVHLVVEAAGETRMREVFALAHGDLTAYPGAGPRETVAVADGWKRLLDLVEPPEAPSSASVAGAFERYVLGAGDRRALDARADARAAYRDLLAAGGGWLPPWYVRQPMGEWRFPAAEARIDEANAVLQLRTLVDEEATALGLDPDDALRAAYEAAAGDLTPAMELAGDQLAALDAIDGARLALAGERDLVTTIGLLDATPEARYAEARQRFEAGELDAAIEAASAAAAVIAGAAAVGQGRVLVAAAVLAAALLLLLLLALVVRRRRRRAWAVAGAPDAYATLAADPDGLPAPPPGPASEGGGGEGAGADDP